MPIAAGTALLGSAVVGGISSILAGLLGSNAANNAATVQNAGAMGSLALQKEALDFQKESSLPWIASGRVALNQYMRELGLPVPGNAGPGSQYRPPAGTGFRRTPGYDFQVKEGERGVTNNLAALGMKNSGAALKALTRFRLGLADTTYQNYLTRLSNVATGGQQQVANTNSLVANAAQNMGQTTQDAAAATASGYVNSANSWINAANNVSNTTGNALGWASRQNPWARAA